jgi:hypothetical protein
VKRVPAHKGLGSMGSGEGNVKVTNVGVFAVEKKDSKKMDGDKNDCNRACYVFSQLQSTIYTFPSRMHRTISKYANQ